VVYAPLGVIDDMFTALLAAGDELIVRNLFMDVADEAVFAEEMLASH